MFHADKALPPPPLPAKPRNESMAASLPTYRSRPEPKKDGFSSFSVSAARAMFETSKPSAPSQRPTSHATSASNHLFDLMAANPNATRNVASFGVQQAQKHPDVAKKVATSAFEHAQNKPDVARQSWQPMQPTTTTTTTTTPTTAYHQSSVKSLKSELETKLTIGNPPGRVPRPLSSEPPPAQISPSFDAFHTDVDRDRSWDRSAAVSRSRSSHSFSDRKAPPKRPPPPKFGAMRKSPTISGIEQQSVKEPHAIAKYKYDAAHFDELPCNVNDTIILKREVDDQWIYAFNTRTGQHGIVPIAFLDVKVPLTPTPSLSSTPTVDSRRNSGIIEGPRCRALYNYDSVSVGDLQFEAGETIRLLKRVSDEWLEGETVGGRRGMFPKNFVEIIENLPDGGNSRVSGLRSAPTQPQGCVVNALFDYNSGHSEDLVFQRGDQVEVLETVNSEWSRGRLVRTPNVVGLFPTNFVEAHHIISAGPVSPTTGISSPTSPIGGSLVGKTVTALFDYRGEDSSDLWFSVGDRILVTEETNSDWLKGRHAGMANQRNIPEGLFPRSFVQID